jgi:ATP-dependent Lhr-like helicase
MESVRVLWFAEESAGLSKDEVLKKCVQGWVQIFGPIAANAFASRLLLDPAAVFQTFIGMEVQGLLMRGSFEKPATLDDYEIEWCERRILQRIHRLTLGTLRKKVEPVSPAAYMQWVLGWQHLAPQTQLAGEEGLLEALSKLEGFEAPAIEWERTLLPARVANFDPAWLDRLCLSGTVGWGRVSPHPAWSVGDGSAPRRVIPTNAAPITFYLRDSANWLAHALEDKCVDEANLLQALTGEAQQVRGLLRQRGACFAEDVQRILNLTRQQTQQALWELAAAGLAAADGFDQLRVMIDPDRKPTTVSTHRKIRSSAGRWSLFNSDIGEPKDSLEKARSADAAVESAARMLLVRYGVVFRDLVVRESNAPKWSILLRMLRRLEDRGEVRGGRFVSGFGGEQFALPEIVESLREARHREMQGAVTIAGADPMNLVGIIVPGERVAAVPGRSVMYPDLGDAHNKPAPSLPRHRSPRRESRVLPQPVSVRVVQPTGSGLLF